MPKVLTEDELDRYERDGVHFPIPVLSAEETSKYLDAANDLEERLGGRPHPIEMSQLNVHFQWAHELVTHPKILDSMEDLLGPNLIVWSAGLMPKHPHDSGYISWHQDGTYWNLDSSQVGSAWVALSNSLVENGCMRVVPGSHRMDIQPHKQTFAKDNLLTRGQEIEVAVREEDVTDIVLVPGEMSLHHVRIIHGSSANRSDEKRVGFVIRYVTPAVRQIGDKPKALLARGRDDYGHYDLIDPPGDVSMDVAVAELKESTRAHHASVMKVN